MDNPERRWFGRFLLALVLAVPLVTIVYPLVSIQLRLSRNGALARSLVESLNDRFPEAVFRGGASYEREVIYITALGRLEDSRRREVEQWLRDKKAEQRILPEIYLDFSNEGFDYSKGINKL